MGNICGGKWTDVNNSDEVAAPLLLGRKLRIFSVEVKSRSEYQRYIYIYIFNLKTYQPTPG